MACCEQSRTVSRSRGSQSPAAGVIGCSAQTGGRRRASFPPSAEWPCKRAGQRALERCLVRGPVMEARDRSVKRRRERRRKLDAHAPAPFCPRDPAPLLVSPRPARLDSRIAHSHGLSRRQPATLVPVPCPSRTRKSLREPRHRTLHHTPSPHPPRPCRRRSSSPTTPRRTLRSGRSRSSSSVLKPPAEMAHP
jgi:hypothetical protein